MHIEVANNNGTKYLRLAHCRRGTNKKGVKTIVKQIVLNIGPLSRFDDGEPNYLERLRASFRDGRPLIDALKPYVGDAPKAKTTVTFVEGDATCIGSPKRLADVILDPVFEALGLISNHHPHQHQLWYNMPRYRKKEEFQT